MIICRRLSMTLRRMCSWPTLRGSARWWNRTTSPSASSSTTRRPSPTTSRSRIGWEQFPDYYYREQRLISHFILGIETSMGIQQNVARIIKEGVDKLLDIFLFLTFHIKYQIYLVTHKKLTRWFLIKYLHKKAPTGFIRGKAISKSLHQQRLL